MSQAGLLVLGAAIAWATVRTPAQAAPPACTVHCGVGAPPLEPVRRTRDVPEREAG
ncbi:hypothetical protein F0344_18930 [Streptomyces finlayi]|uniref:Uncharacterized protein n=1 Tax=Streptomyces finlayi TaxID=67296 RepID=A0A7G7BM57_9ACTN|nr:hypothetical protein F0344_18930 [Streptomyces finlayi]